MLEAGSKSFANCFHRAVLEGNRSEGGGSEDTFRLGQQGNMCTVDATEIGDAIMEVIEQKLEVGGDKVPSSPVEAGAETVRPGGAYVINWSCS
jgi:hypothetical protein